jgi:hypothetical protein
MQRHHGLFYAAILQVAGGGGPTRVAVVVAGLPPDTAVEVKTTRPQRAPEWKTGLEKHAEMSIFVC